MLNFFVDEEQETSVLDDYFLGNVKNLAIGYLKDFFCGKELHCGGRINPKVLSSSACLDRVLNTSIEKGVPLAYELIASERIPGGTSIVLQVFEKCSRLGIPKCFRAGILLVYLELCHGVTAA